jgi:hypothetical protein
MYFLGLNLFNGSGYIGWRNPIARGSSLRAVSRADVVVEETLREVKLVSLFSIFADIHRAKIRSIY